MNNTIWRRKLEEEFVSWRPKLRYQIMSLLWRIACA